MNSTPNYGYETHSSAISVIDRDIKRVEDKADANAAVITHHAERITRGEERIACLAKQKCDVYSKCETDRLLDSKVDKKDGHGLISDECLHQICTNKGDISLLEQYVCDLKNKIDNMVCVEYDLPVVDGYLPMSGYMSKVRKNAFGEVNIVCCTIRSDGTSFPISTEAPGTKIAQLPEGLRPSGWVSIPGSLRYPSTKRGSCSVYIQADGSIHALIPNDVADTYQALEFSVSYLTAQ